MAGSLTMSSGPVPAPRAASENSVTTPAGVMRPMALLPNSVNQRLPSAPRVMLSGWAPTAADTLLLPSAATPTKLSWMTFPVAGVVRVPSTWMPSRAFPETTLRSAGLVEPITLSEALTMRMPSPPLLICVVPAGLTPTKLPKMLLPLLWTRMPTPPLPEPSAWKLVMSRPSMVLPPLPLPRVSPLTFGPASAPSIWIRMTALSPLARVLAWPARRRCSRCSR